MAPADLQGAPSCGGSVVLPTPQCIAVALGRQPRHAEHQELGCLSAGVGTKQWKENIRVAIKVEVGKAKYM